MEAFNVIETPLDAAVLKIQRAGVALTRHISTRMFTPFFVDGKHRVEPDTGLCPTAYTDGANEVYGADFVNRLPNDKQIRFLVMHEKGHKFLMHFLRMTPDMKADPQLFNIAADYAVNGMLFKICFQYPDFMEMIPDALYDAKYDGWALIEIFNDLKQQQQQGGGGGMGQPLDQHDTGKMSNATPDQIEQAAKQVNENLRQGGMMAGKFGGEVPVEVENALAPDVNWKKETEEWWHTAAHGRDEFTWRRYNRRRLVDDLYVPGVRGVKLDEIIIAIDSSGSTYGKVLGEFVDSIRLLCMQTSPKKLRIIWWDTTVHAEQVFEGNYENVSNSLRPVGGGGTRVGCVSDYLKDNKNMALIVFTDGEVEQDIQWELSCPTLWLVTRKRDFVPPSGKLVQIMG
jgi:predicted metal-dependent peptidase